MMPAGTIVIAHSHDDDDALEEVRAEIERRGYNADTVRIKRKGGQILVELKMDMRIGTATVCPSQ